MLSIELKIERKEANEYEPLPEDVYQVELLDITEKRVPTYKTRNEPDEKKEYETVMNFQFTVLDGVDEKGESARGRNLFKGYVPTYLYVSSKNGKNDLYKIVEALLGRDLTQKDEAFLDGRFLNQLIGKQIRVGTVNKTIKDKTYSNIDKFLKANTLINALTPEEKAKATIKPKDGEKTVDNVEIGGSIEQYPVDDINPEDIPF